MCVCVCVCVCVLGEGKLTWTRTLYWTPMLGHNVHTNTALRARMMCGWGDMYRGRGVDLHDYRKQVRLLSKGCQY